jgi:hypothetical protein
MRRISGGLRHALAAAASAHAFSPPPAQRARHATQKMRRLLQGSAKTASAAGSRWPAPCGPKGLPEAQGTPAPRAPGSSHGGLDSAACPPYLGCDGTAAEHLAGLGAQGSGARAAQAVIAHWDAARRQHGLEQPPPARLGRHGTHCDLGRGRCLILQGALAICEREHAVMAEGHADHRRGQRAHSLLTPADWLTMPDPILAPYGLIDAGDQGGLFPSVSALRAAEPGQWLDGP